MSGRKTIETRSWATKYRGTLAIHASMKINYNACWEFGFSTIDVNLLPKGAVLGTVKLVDCVRFPNPCAPPDEYGDFTEGRFGWLLEDVKKFEHPIPAKGHLGLWEWEGMP
jgi:hypothetical protein